MSEVFWEDPPPPKTGPVALHSAAKELAEQLRANPGRWARWHVVPHAQAGYRDAYGVRSGKFKAFQPAGVFESRAAKVDGAWWVYVRYVGEEVNRG